MTEGELNFDFSLVSAEKLDEPGKPIPAGMMLVDFVVEEEKRTLLVEVKDPSHSRAHEPQRNKFAEEMKSDTLINEKLTPKVRDSYAYLHLMKRDSKPFLYVVLLGFDAMDKALLINFRDRLLARIRQEADKPWIRQYVYDCVVLSVDQWNHSFSEYPVTRIRRP